MPGSGQEAERTGSHQVATRNWSRAGPAGPGGCAERHPSRCAAAGRRDHARSAERGGEDWTTGRLGSAYNGPSARRNRLERT